MPDQNVGTIFRGRFDIVLVLLVFCFILVITKKTKVKIWCFAQRHLLKKNAHEV